MAPTNSGSGGSGGTGNSGGSGGSSVWFQKSFSLPAQARGAYLVTELVEAQLAPQLARVRAGLLHVFVQHTSCALALSENWDADVRRDMSDALDRLAPEDARYRHSAEGPDDMPVCFFLIYFLFFLGPGGVFLFRIGDLSILFWCWRGEENKTQ
jgi:hypothetical protein